MTAYKITHVSTYEYIHSVSLSHNEAYLIPKNLPWQQCRKNQIKVHPKPSVLDRSKDFFGNQVVYFTIQNPHRTLKVKSVSLVQLDNKAPIDLTQSIPWEQYLNQLNQPDNKELIEAKQFIYPSQFVPIGNAFRAYAEPSFSTHALQLEAVFDFMSRIHAEFTYNPAATTVSTPVEEVMEKKHGVCQDFSHAAIACLRSFGIPARYVSGYLETLPPPGQPRLVGADASHAWFSVYDPHLGWVDFDPTNNQLINSQYITVAWGRDYRDVSPLRGLSLGSTTQTIKVSVDVKPISGEGSSK